MAFMHAFTAVGILQLMQRLMPRFGKNIFNMESNNDYFDNSGKNRVIFDTIQYAIIFANFRKSFAITKHPIIYGLHSFNILQLDCFVYRKTLTYKTDLLLQGLSTNIFNLETNDTTVNGFFYKNKFKKCKIVKISLCQKMISQFQ